MPSRSRAAFFYFELHIGQDIPIVPAVIISVLVFAPLLGLALDYVLLRRLAKAPVYARIVGTIGLLVALPAIAQWLVETLGNTVFELDLPLVSQMPARADRRDRPDTGTGVPARGAGRKREHRHRPAGGARRRRVRRVRLVVGDPQDTRRSRDASGGRPRTLARLRGVSTGERRRSRGSSR